MNSTSFLNPQQKEATFHVEGPLLVLAGAGSGKTQIITHRIAHLLEIGVPAEEILAMTFTNKAADEMRHRIFHLTHKQVLACTFHSLCARILRESISSIGFSPNFTIYDEEDSEKALKECFKSLNIKEEKGAIRQIRSQISQAKNALLQPESFSRENQKVEKIYHLYQENLQGSNALDFDDLLFLTVKLFSSNPDILKTYQQRWRFILIDEYQDTNAAQYKLTKDLSEEHQNVFAVGDPDQSIYSWRGANIHNILNFEQDFSGAKIIRLEQNYRSCSNILQAANALIRHNTSRYEKALWSDRGEGEKITCYIAENDRAEADFVVKQLYKLRDEKEVPFNESVIFYRTNFQSRIFEDYLIKAGIPYVIVGGLSFYQRKEVKDLLCLMRVVISGHDYLAFARTINLPKRGLGETTLERLRENALEKNLSIFDYCTLIAEGKESFKSSQKQLEGLRGYVNAIAALREMVKQRCSLSEVFSSAIERCRYLEYLREDPESYEERRGNIEELISKAAEWEGEVENPSLATFLEELMLKSSADERREEREQVRLMTLHHGKGLEFTAVFVVGMEEELFPHANSLQSDELLEEERRLCYVGLTRAKERLYLTASSYRYLWGMPKVMRPSRFLKEIPEKYFCFYHRNEIFKEKTSSWQEPEIFQLGDSVVHADFGVGSIQKAYQTSLGLTYDVYFFQTRTLRSLVAKFAKLKKQEVY